MAQVLTEKVVRDLPAPATGNRVHYDQDVKGFGVRVTRAGARAFVLNYTASGRERRQTIGSHPDWSVQAAREEAKRLKRLIDVGGDPMADREAERGAPTVADLAERFLREHGRGLRPKTLSEYESMLRLYVVPALGRIRLANLSKDDVAQLHQRVARKYPYRANRIVNLVSTLIRWSCARPDNPAAEVRLAPEEERERPLTDDEIGRLCDALDRLPNPVSADALRLLLLTGARKMEACGARWSEFALDAGVWTKPATRMKGKKKHPIPLSDAATTLLTTMRKEALAAGRILGPEHFVFPGDGAAGHLADVKSAWCKVTRDASIGRFVDKADRKGVLRRKWVSDVRPHDLRHTFASIAASNSHSLPVVGRLLGHRRSGSTARYAHLADPVLRTAANQVANAVRSGRGRTPSGASK